MTYKERVRNKIASGTARREERGQLWAEIAKEYEEEGTQGVESMLTKKMEELAVQFRHVLGKLERML